MSLGRQGPLVPVDDAIVQVSEAELDFDAAPEDVPAQASLAGAGSPVGMVRLVARSARGRLLGALLTRALGWLTSWTAYELRREYLSRLGLAQYQHQKALAAAERKAVEWQARAEALEMEKELLTTLHVRTMTRINSETLAYAAAGKATSQRDE